MNRIKRPKKISTCEEGAVPPVIVPEPPKSLICGKKRKVKEVASAERKPDRVERSLWLEAPEEESLKIVI